VQAVRAPSRSSASRQLLLFDPGRIGLGRLRLVTEQLNTITSARQVTVGEAVAYAVDRTKAGERLTPASLATFGPIWTGFARFASRALNVDRLDQVDRAAVDRYLEVPTRTGRVPSVATKHLRRAALRHLFMVLRDAGLMSTDPTCDLHLPTRPPRPFRPLTTAEVERCRAASQATLVATREPAVWALAEIGATGLEIGETTTWCISGASVWLYSGVKTDPREVTATPWGEQALRRRLLVVDGGRWLISADTSTTPHSRRTAALEALRRTMRRAGVAAPGVEPRSVTAWAGQQILARTGRIEDVAVGLGLRSLDQAAELIDHEWRDT
jgi:integrase/recombinase XerC